MDAMHIDQYAGYGFAAGRRSPGLPGAWALDRGASAGPANGVDFRVWAPNARRVDVLVGDTAHAMAPGQGGVFEAHDAAWRGLPMADYVIYEVHVGAFTRAGTFDAAIEYLPQLAELGITAIELMPVAEFPGTRNWGYDGVHLYAPQHSYGGPDALRRLVDAAHGAGLAVILDVVYNHVGPEGSALNAYGPYLSATHASPWGASFDFDGPSPSHAEVRRYVIDNALSWIVEYHIDALRLDAVPAIRDDSTPHI